MEINKFVLNKNLDGIISNFIPLNFNKLSVDERKDSIKSLSNLVANSLNINIDTNKILFVEKEKLFGSGALFNFKNETLLFDKGILYNKLGNADLISVLDNITHETIHYCQKQHNLFLEHLETPLSPPYDLLQPHEIEAHNLTNEFLNEYEKFLNNEQKDLINVVVQLKAGFKKGRIEDLKRRGYKTDDMSISEQIKEILPFQKNINIIYELLDNGMDLKIAKRNQNITAGQISKNEFYGIININENENNINKLHFTITNNICYINDIYNETKTGELYPVSRKNKEKLVNLLNKIIKVGNKNQVFRCDNFIVNPISIVDDKNDYNKFIKDIKNNSIRISEKITDISKKQIEKEMFKDIKER